MLTVPELRRLKAKCASLSEGPDYRDPDYVRNLLTTSLDFQLHVSVVNRALDAYKTNLWHGLRNHSDLQAFLGSYKNTKPGNLRAADALWRNKCWTRVEFLRAIVSYFDSRGVKDIRGLRHWAQHSNFEENVRGQVRSAHHSMGPAIYNWLLLRVGVPTIKPDVHVRRFVASCIGRKPRTDEVVKALLDCAEQLNRQPYELDAAIWHYQSGYA